MKVQLRKSFSFEAAHSHPGAPVPFSGIHGHSFRVEALVEGPVCPERGWLADFADIKRALKPAVDALDHYYLNEIEGLADPSPERIAAWVTERIAGLLPFEIRILVDCRDTAEPEIALLPPDPRLGLPERHSLRFEAAHYLPKTPSGHKCRRLHGHSYLLEVAANNPDSVPAALENLFKQVDHIHLNDMDWLPNPTAERMSQAFWGKLSEMGVEPTCLALSETCESGVVYFGE